MKKIKAFISQFSTKIVDVPTIVVTGKYNHETMVWEGMDVYDMPDTKTKTHKVISSDDEGDY